MPRSRSVFGLAIGRDTARFFSGFRCASLTLVIAAIGCSNVQSGREVKVSSAAVPQRLTVLENQTVYESPADYAAFPDIISTDGKLIVAFEAQNLDQLKAASVRHPHYRPVARPLWAVSTNGAASWSVTDVPPSLGKVQDFTFGGGLEGGGMFSLKWGYIKGTKERPPFTLKIFKSQLGTPSQSEQIPIFDNVYLQGVTRLPDGGYLASGYEPAASSTGITLYHGIPDALHWEKRSHIANPSDVPFLFSEAALAAYPNGRVVVVMRADWLKRADPEGKFKPGNFGYWLYQAVSGDFGRTWSQPQRLPIWGHPPYLLKLRSGDLLMVYGERRPPYSVHAVLSHDRGETWDIGSTVTLHKFDPGAWDLGYPVATQLEDGRIVVVYYGYSTQNVELISPHGIFATILQQPSQP